MDYMDIDLALLLTHFKRELPHRVCKCYLYQVSSFVGISVALHVACLLNNGVNVVHNNLASLFAACPPGRRL